MHLCRCTDNMNALNEYRVHILQIANCQRAMHMLHTKNKETRDLIRIIASDGLQINQRKSSIKTQQHNETRENEIKRSRRRTTTTTTTSPKK